MLINGAKYRVRPMTAGDLAVIGPLARRVMPHLSESGADMMGLVELWPEIIDAAGQLLDGTEPARLRDLPLHEAVGVLESLVQEWLAVNGLYMAESVAPAVSQLSQMLVSVIGRAFAGRAAPAAATGK